MSKIITYDKKELYTTEIEPKIIELRKLCIKYDIPFMTVFATANSEISTDYAIRGLLPGVQGIKLKEDRLKDIYGILSGYNDKEIIDVSDDDDDDDFPDEV